MDPNEHNTEPPSTPSTSYARVLGQFVTFVVGKWSSVEDTVDRLFGKMSNGGRGSVFVHTIDPKHVALLLAVIRDNEAMVARTLDIDVSLVRKLDVLIRARMERMSQRHPAQPTQSPTSHELAVSVDDCMDANVIEVVCGTTTLYVPSWHYMVSFAVDDATVSFELKMALEDDVDVDEDNNLVVRVWVGIDQLMCTDKIDVPVGGRVFQVPVKELRVMRTQTYVFEGAGIPRISERDIYRCHDRADVMVVVSIV
jgi:hypothetical protein